MIENRIQADRMWRSPVERHRFEAETGLTDDATETYQTRFVEWAASQQQPIKFETAAKTCPACAGRGELHLKNVAPRPQSEAGVRQIISCNFCEGIGSVIVMSPEQLDHATDALNRLRHVHLITRAFNPAKKPYVLWTSFDPDPSSGVQQLLDVYLNQIKLICSLEQIQCLGPDTVIFDPFEISTYNQSIGNTLRASRLHNIVLGQTLTRSILKAMLQA